jgi:hypothetical protein
MRYNVPKNSNYLQHGSRGPAAVAANALAARKINLGLRQSPYVNINADMMRRGGSLGCCGLSGLGAVAVAPMVQIGPIAQKLMQLRKSMSAKAALAAVMIDLHSKGYTTVTPEIHLQLAAGMQPAPGLLNGFLGALGLAPVAGAGMTAGSIAATAAGAGAVATGATAAGLTVVGTGLGAGIMLGQTAIPIPVVGAVIGAIVFEAVHLLSNKHVGKATAAWTSPGFYASLRTTAGRDYDEKQFSEAFKGMMDTGNNIIGGCGADRHKDPDCFMQPLAGAIAQGYLSQTVPLSATTQQVFQNVVIPWLKSGGGATQVHWNTLAGEPTQQLMIQAATDRYLADQPVTRGDMASYGNVGMHTPTLVQALQPILQQPTTTTPQVNAPVTAPGYVQPGSNQPGVGVPAPPSIDQPVGAPTPYSGGGGPNPTTPYYSPGSYSPAPISVGAGGGGGGAGAPGAAPTAIPWGPIIAGGAAILTFLK